MPPLRRAPVKPFRMAAFLFLCLAGCAHTRAAAPATKVTADPDYASQYVETVDATASIPVGWRAEPLKSSATHAHQVWLSPSGHTAYGIIRFKLPIPVGRDLALFGFLQNMKMSEGEANLISKEWDPNKKTLRFV